MTRISQREKEVLELISLEFSSKEISSQLFISLKTVESHRRNLFHKMDVKNAAGLIRKAFEVGFLKLSA